ncbi:MAG TPA: family 10 glycosylhydrolase [Gemmatimonadaceae bacterium]|nr:family 10 glycosylhydrolase [Gemmatimonadaceae bacterium]
MKICSLLVSLLLFGATPGEAQAPPAIQREFRAIWVATVANIDWPSKPGLSTWDQQRELLAILDRAASLHLNAVILQVRPGADAFYASPYEPWSQFLTGRQGRAPEPPWDPLAFAVEQAHKRGLELHAWFNPYRAAYTRDTAFAASHITQKDPAAIWRYDRFLWMDPGDADVRRRSVRAIVDVAKRYDVDGIHIDDYFYPYPVNDASGKQIDFPDSLTYARYVKSGGTLAKDAWRRDNVNKLVEALYKGVHAAKPWVKVGISPFGIWRPGNPEQIKGFDAYAEIYADSKLWLQKGWADYFAPQLYWPIAPPQQSFPVLLDWWRSVNVKGRHIWPGLATYRIAENSARRIPAQEILNEIDTMRVRATDIGHIHFNTTVLMKDADSVDEQLMTRYAQPALIPASPWLGAKPPARPRAALALDAETKEPIVKLVPAAKSLVWLWTVRSRANGVWTSEVLPGWLRSHRLPFAADSVVVTAVSRTGVESAVVTAR